MGLKILKKVELTQVRVWMCGSFVSGTALECLHLIINELARGNLAPVGNNLKGGVKWNE